MGKALRLCEDRNVEKNGEQRAKGIRKQREREAKQGEK